jgi:N-methylhydantoinase B
MPAEQRVDPVLVEVLGNYFRAVADEMGVVLIRSAYSTNIKERRDAACALFDAAGRTIAQANDVPLMMGSMLGIVDETLARFPLGSIQPGDVFIANDPYAGGGTHLPDVTVATPAFHDGRLVGWAAICAHHSDVGGSPARATDIFAEGLRLPPVRIVEGGRLREDVFDFILLNCRLRTERVGDFRAQFAAARTGAERLVEACQKYGPDVISAAVERLFAVTEARFRRQVADLPDGRYCFEDQMDDDGVSDDPVTIRAEITIEGDALTIDFAGSDAQRTSSINLSWQGLVAAVYYSFKALLDPDIPTSAGYYHAIDLRAPEGSVVRSVAPAPVLNRSDVAQRVVDVIFGAMAQVLPERVIAASNGAIIAAHFHGHDPRTNDFYSYPETIGGGMGASLTKDGIDAVQVHMTNTSNLPVEALEAEYPLRVERYELVSDSGGAGTYRGGLGIRRVYRVLAEGTRFRSKGDRARFAPWGLAGGGPGGRAAFVVNPGLPSERVLSTKAFNEPLQPGDLLEVRSPGAGGCGDPRQRDPDAVRRDVQAGKVSPAAAVAQYGRDEAEVAAWLGEPPSSG